MEASPFSGSVQPSAALTGETIFFSLGPAAVPKAASICTQARKPLIWRLLGVSCSDERSMSTPDEELVNAAIDGDGEALAQLLRQHGPVDTYHSEENRIRLGNVGRRRWSGKKHQDGPEEVAFHQMISVSRFGHHVTAEYWRPTLGSFTSSGFRFTAWRTPRARRNFRPPMRSEAGRPSGPRVTADNGSPLRFTLSACSS